jgi:NTE family protein
MSTGQARRGLALAGGGPLGAIYELGALVALDEALPGFGLVDCDVHVGVSAGAVIAAGLANGLTPREMHQMFVGSLAGGDPFEPELLLRPACREFVTRFAALLPLFVSALRHYVERPFSHGIVESFQQLGRALPTGVFDNAPLAAYLERLFSAGGRTDDFRSLARRLFIVATDLDSGQSVPFGAPGHDDVPISLAVQASTALPGLYPPVRIGEHTYVDGVLNKTLHASLALNEGVKLLICINPLVPFDRALSADGGAANRGPLGDYGLPVVLSQTFRTIIRSRMKTAMGRYAVEYPDADIVLFEPPADDPEMFFVNVFSYADRRRMCEHAYKHTRVELRRRAQTLEPILARHGVAIDHAVLADGTRALLPKKRRQHALRRQSRWDGLTGLTHDLDRTLGRLETILMPTAAGQASSNGPPA